ncbi:hypothetical protein [Xanthomonas citri]|uniref:hypothetical protein n=1 Tax=Xanthomonas citri TaxID=346 RepID=UPI0022B4F8E0|nr:hypothetical protein [Xanthomonas citri]
MLRQHADSSDAEQDQRNISKCTDRHHQSHMLALEPLPQHEGILRADRDDETGTGKETGHCCLNDHGVVSEAGVHRASSHRIRKTK